MSKSRKLTAFLLLTVLLTLPASSTAAPAQPAFNTNGLGFTMSLIENNSVAADMGAQWAEYTLSWEVANPANGSYNWGDANNIMNGAAGLNIIIRVMDTPAWARVAGSPSSRPPSNMATFTTFMQALTNHLVNDLGKPPAAFEFWNEPNLDYNWGNLCPNPSQYMQLIQAGRSGVRAVSSTIKIVAGAVTTVAEYRPDAAQEYDAGVQRKPFRGIDGRISDCHLDDILYIRGMYQNTAGVPSSVFDVLSTHPYGFNNTPEKDPRTSNYLTFRRAELQHNEMAANGDAGKKMWATEMGWAINPASVAGATDCAQPAWYYIWTQQQQANNLVGAVQWARSYWPWMEVMIVFDLDFSLAPWYDRCHPFNFFAVYGYHTAGGFNRSPRPAYTALQGWLANPPATYTPTARPATATATSTALPSPTATPGEQPPSVRDVTLNQTRFSSGGGSLSVTANVSDPDSSPVTNVYLIVNEPLAPGDTVQPQTIVPMTLISGSTATGTWEGSYPVPANSSGGDLAYSAQVLANDTAANSYSSGLYPFTVTNLRFWDVPANYWAGGYIGWLAGQNIIGGYPDCSFRPNANTRRDEMAKLLSVAYGWPLLNPSTPTFSDVAGSYWAYRYVETAAARGVVSGYPNGLFRPANVVNRGELSKMIVRGVGWPLQNPPSGHFSDVLPGSWSYPYVETAAAYEVIAGYSNGSFQPARSVSRAELSKIIYTQLRLTLNTATATSAPSPTTTTTTTASPAVATATPTSSGPTFTASPTVSGTVASATASTTVPPSPTRTRTPTATPTPLNPVATGINPAAAVAGSSVTVTISGGGFGSTQGSSSLLINNTAMTIITWADGAISFQLPFNTPSSPDPAIVSLLVRGQIVNVPANFSVLPGLAKK